MQTDLCEFHNSQDYTEKPCLKTKPTPKKHPRMTLWPALSCPYGLPTPTWTFSLLLLLPQNHQASKTSVLSLGIWNYTSSSAWMMLCQDCEPGLSWTHTTGTKPLICFLKTRLWLCPDWRVTW